MEMVVDIHTIRTHKFQSGWTIMNDNIFNDELNTTMEKLQLRYMYIMFQNNIITIIIIGSIVQ